MVWILKVVKRVEREKTFSGLKPRRKRSDHTLAQLIEKKINKVWNQYKCRICLNHFISFQNTICFDKFVFSYIYAENSCVLGIVSEFLISREVFKKFKASKRKSFKSDIGIRAYAECFSSDLYLNSFRGKNIIWIYNHEQNIWDKLCLSYEIGHYGKNSISMFQEFLASIEKKFFLGGRLSSRL